MRAFALVAALLLSATLAGCSGSDSGDAVIFGKVKDKVSNQYVGGALVTLDNGDETRTGADGSYRFEGLAEREYTLVVEHNGRQSNPQIVMARVTGGGSVEIAV